jgi:hypothetical protein
MCRHSSRTASLIKLGFSSNYRWRPIDSLAYSHTGRDRTCSNPQCVNSLIQQKKARDLTFGHKQIIAIQAWILLQPSWVSHLPDVLASQCRRRTDVSITHMHDVSQIIGIHLSSTPVIRPWLAALSTGVYRIALLHEIVLLQNFWQAMIVSFSRRSCEGTKCNH